jgi:hypothetical protein
MNYSAAKKQLHDGRFTRLERDDRFFDLFPDQTREKGIELWERWEPENISYVRLRIGPYDEKKTDYFCIPKAWLETALLSQSLGTR